FEEAPVQTSVRDQDPLGEVARLGQTIFGWGPGAALFRGLVLGVPISLLWGVLGVGLTRWAELARKRDLLGLVEYNRRRIPVFMARKWPSALAAVLLVVIFAGVVTLPGVLAGLLNCIPAVGAIIVAVFLPVFLACNLALVLTSAGVVCHWLIP